MKKPGIVARPFLTFEHVPTAHRRTTRHDAGKRSGLYVDTSRC